METITITASNAALIGLIIFVAIIFIAITAYTLGERAINKKWTEKLSAGIAKDWIWNEEDTTMVPGSRFEARIEVVYLTPFTTPDVNLISGTTEKVHFWKRFPSPEKEEMIHSGGGMKKTV